MTLEELKALWDAALEKSKAAPEDAELKTAADAAEQAYNDAKAAADKAPESLDETKWDDKTKAYIQRLRGESAGYRTKNKDLVSKVKTEQERVKAILKAAGIEDESEAPEVKIKSLTDTSTTLAFRNAVLESAVQHGIPAEELEFYEYLIAKKASELEEGEELSDEALTEIVSKVKKTSKGSASSSVGTGKGGGAAPKPGASEGVSLDDFVRMSITEKSALFTKNPELYNRLIAEAKAKKRLV